MICTCIGLYMSIVYSLVQVFPNTPELKVCSNKTHLWITAVIKDSQRKKKWKDPVIDSAGGNPPGVFPLLNCYTYVATNLEVSVTYN